MKITKFLLAVSVICALATINLLGQARVNFANTSNSPLRITDGTISPTGTILFSGSVTQILGTASTATFGIGPASVRVELLAGTSPGTLSLIPVGTAHNVPYVTNVAVLTPAAAQGAFAGGTVLPLPSEPGFDGSAPVFFEFRAWSIGADNALSFDDRLLSGTGFAGYSKIISVTPTVGVNLPAQLFGGGPEQWQGLTLYTVVPEPTVVALVGLGVAMCMTFRMRGRKL